MDAERPARLVVVAGTGTEIGKTWAAARLAESWRSHEMRVCARKPAQSFEPGEGPTDAEVLAAATGERPHDVCPAHRWYPTAMAPFMAADALGRPPFSLDDLAGEISWPAGADVGLVEGAGGVRSPVTSDGADTVDLADVLAPDAVLLVADAGLGTINAVRLSLAALAGHPSVVLLNRYEEGAHLHRRNRDWLTANVEAPVATTVEEARRLLG